MVHGGKNSRKGTGGRFGHIKRSKGGSSKGGSSKGESSKGSSKGK